MEEKQKELLIGNGINRMADCYPTWNDLLKHLCEQFDVNVNISEEKPYPHLFEEIIHRMKMGKDLEDRVKKVKQEAVAF